MNVTTHKELAPGGHSWMAHIDFQGETFTKILLVVTYKNGKIYEEQLWPE